MELNYIEKEFRVNNKYPVLVIKKILQQAKQQHQITAHAAIFYYSPKGEKGEHLIKSMKKRNSELLLPEIEREVTYTAKN